MSFLGTDDQSEQLLSHPRQRTAERSLTDLIEQLRTCSSERERYEFQQELLARLLAVEADRNAFSQAVKRLRQGKAPQPGVPEPKSGMDTALPEAWQLELDLCERLARQYRCVGDALAWRVFQFQRRYILALCQNAPPGVMAGKEGLKAERAFLTQTWNEGNRFTLLHDLTNCLRIGDATVFGDGPPRTVEVKTDARRRSAAQLRRVKTARLALQDAGPLSAADPKLRLLDLDIPLRTHLDLLSTGMTRATTEGIFAAKMPGYRALVVIDMDGCQSQGWTSAEFGQRLERKLAGVLRRAHIGGDREWNVLATSLDSASRDPLRVPFAAYPLHPILCARLITDRAIFSVETRGPALAQMLCEAGLDAHWARSASKGQLSGNEVVMRVRTSTEVPTSGGYNMELSRVLEMRRSELDRYLIELLDPGTWIAGIRYLLNDQRASGRPWPYYRDEHLVWM